MTQQMRDLALLEFKEPDQFQTMAAAGKAGKAALKQLLGELNS